MGEVIAFRASTRRARDAKPPSGDAQILFFLGVRYMRIEEPTIGSEEISPGRRDTPNGGKRRKSRARA